MVAGMNAVVSSWASEAGLTPKGPPDPALVDALGKANVEDISKNPSGSYNARVGSPEAANQLADDIEDAGYARPDVSLSTVPRRFLTREQMQSGERRTTEMLPTGHFRGGDAMRALPLIVLICLGLASPNLGDTLDMSCRSFPPAIEPGQRLCEGDELTDEQIKDLLDRVNQAYLAEQRRDWDFILDQSMCSDDYPSLRNWKARQKRVWKSESKGWEMREWRVLSIQRCGDLAYVLTRVWGLDFGDPFNSDEGSWWIKTPSGWRQTQEVFRRLNTMGRKLIGSKESMGVDSPAERFLVIYENPEARTDD